MKKTFLAIALCASSLAHASALAEYKVMADYWGQACQDFFLAGNIEGARETGEKCVSDGKGVVKELFGSALAEVKGKSAREALKTHFVKSVAAVEGAIPASGESRIAYGARQGMLQSSASEAWTRFMLER